MSIEDFKNTLRCPLTQKYFRVPIVFNDGVTYEKEALKNKYAFDKETLNEIDKIPESALIQKQIKLLFASYPEEVNDQHNNINLITKSICKEILIKSEFDKLLAYTDFELDKTISKNKNECIYFIQKLLKCKNKEIILHVINNSKSLKRDQVISIKNFYVELFFILKSNDKMLIEYILDNYIIQYDTLLYSCDKNPMAEFSPYKTLTIADLICKDCSYDTIEYILNKYTKLLCLNKFIKIPKHMHPITYVHINKNQITDEEKLSFIKLVVSKCYIDNEVITEMFSDVLVVENILCCLNETCLKYLYLNKKCKILWNNDRPINLRNTIQLVLTPSKKFSTSLILDILSTFDHKEILNIANNYDALDTIICYHSKKIIQKIIPKECINRNANGWSIITLLMQYKPSLVTTYLPYLNNFDVTNENHTTPLSQCLERNIDNFTLENIKDKFTNSITLFLLQNTDLNNLSSKAFKKLIYVISISKYLDDDTLRIFIEALKG